MQDAVGERRADVEAQVGEQAGEHRMVGRAGGRETGRAAGVRQLQTSRTSREPTPRRWWPSSTTTLRSMDTPVKRPSATPIDLAADHGDHGEPSPRLPPSSRSVSLVVMQVGPPARPAPDTRFGASTAGASGEGPARRSVAAGEG